MIKFSSFARRATLPAMRAAEVAAVLEEVARPVDWRRHVAYSRDTQILQDVLRGD